MTKKLKTPLPNLFLIGAPKAGTTSVYHYLSQHPDIFMCPLKEPAVFGDENDCRSGAIRDLDQYMTLYVGANGQRVLGEATPTYLCSRSAAVQIHRLIPHAKLIAILRDPGERAYSQYIYMRLVTRLPLEDYGALIRKSSRSLSSFDLEKDDPLCLRPSFYADDIKLYSALFGRHSIHILLYEDLMHYPVETMQGIYRFLGVDPTFTPAVERKYNVTLFPRNRRLHSLLVGEGQLTRAIKQIIPDKLRRPLAKFIYSANMTIRESLPQVDRTVLNGIFREDIWKTQDFIGRDLNHWLR